MAGLTVRDLLDLALSDVEDPFDAIKKLYEWNHARQLEAIKWLFTGALGLFAPIAGAWFTGKLATVNPQFWVYVAVWLPAIPATAAFYLIWRLRNSSKELVAALSLFSRLRKNRQLLERYRELSQEDTSND